LTDPERFARLLSNSAKPVQIIVAGKAHPNDHVGKQFVRDWAKFASRLEMRNHVVFLEDYDIALAQEMVQGVDVWINTPRRPWEACGTSGMKVLVNGGLNLSSLDGWWQEAYAGDVGWALGDERNHNTSRHDGDDAEQLYKLLEEQIVPMFYDRDTVGVPKAWIAKMRASMAKLAPEFSGNRMLREYVESLYIPAARTYQERTSEGCALARKLHQWQQSLQKHWQDVHFGNLQTVGHNNSYRFALQVYLGDISPEHVTVQLYAKSTQELVPVCQTMQRAEAIAGATNGYVYSAEVPADRSAQDYTARVIPNYPGVQVPIELNLIYWQR
jgi:starch phosphorylase